MPFKAITFISNRVKQIIRKYFVNGESFFRYTHHAKVLFWGQILIVYKAFLLLGCIERKLNITFWAEKSYRLLRFGFKIKSTPLEMAPITCPFTRVGRRRRPLRECRIKNCLSKEHFFFLFNLNLVHMFDYHWWFTLYILFVIFWLFLATDSFKINRPGYNINWTNIWQPTIHVQQIFFQKTLPEVCSSNLYASFGTFCVQIGQLLAAQWVLNIWKNTSNGRPICAQTVPKEAQGCETIFCSAKSLLGTYLIFEIVKQGVISMQRSMNVALWLCQSSTTDKF